MIKSKPKCSVIIVTYNSEFYLAETMACLKKQTQAANEILIVDTGSTSLNYLKPYEKDVKIIITDQGSGFCKGNNIGLEQSCCLSSYIFFLNPDAFIAEDYLEKALSFMEDPSNRRCAAVTGTTLGYDNRLKKTTGRYDTTGVFSKWYGGWFDRGQGTSYQKDLYIKIEEIPAICGAVFFSRRQALNEVLIREKEVFDNNFYMYKEDIDLSLRLRRKGWKLMFKPDLLAYHCRGWNLDRSKMPRRVRLCSASNELKINVRRFSFIGTLYSGLKYTAVKLLDI
jgi:N-acetylglucosaminyl-diphospho-decaprenol L-rhamnosyltransferase